MAAVLSVKRPRALTHGIDSGGGASRNGRDKRPRKDTSDDSDQSSIDTQSDAASDSNVSGNEGEQTQEHEQMAWATQQVQRDFQGTANRQNIATDCGIIEEIQCINFMCHEHLTVSLGPLINFIIGHNGSGKSAVLTALTICLGGKATATNRAQNLKSLIKEGKDHSVVTVRIKNQGPLAYKPAYYGDSILVERHFSRSGTSGFKLKDRNGKTVSTKKAELEDILDAFSMQIDNPMNVLTQDMARQFLNHSTPKDKYNFFLKGTQLENLSKDYQQIEQSLDIINAKVELKEGDMLELRRNMEAKEKKARAAQKLEQLRSKERDVAREAAWALVEEEELELTKAEAEVVRVDELIQQREEAVQQASERYERANQAFEAAEQTVIDITAELDPAKELAVDAEAKWTETKTNLLSLKTDQRKAGQDHANKTKEIKKLEAEIEQLRRRQAEADNGTYAAKVRQLEDAKENCKRAKEAYETHGTSLRSIQDELKDAYRVQKEAEQRLGRVREDEKRIRDNIRALQGGQRGWMDGYQNQANLDKLLGAIASENAFREKPVGPMGRHVKLLHSEWGRILEKQSGQSLNAFVVTSKADQTRLSSMMRQYNWQAPVYIGSRSSINTAGNEPDDGLLTWLRALRIDNDLVRNQLIINQNVEQCVLFKDRSQANDFMYGRGTATKNVRMSFTFAGGSTRRGRALVYGNNGAINDSPIDEYQGRLRMQADKVDEIRGEQSRLSQVQQEVQECEEAVGTSRNLLNACKRRELDHQGKKRQLTHAFQAAQEDVDRIEAELSEATPDAAGIEVLEESLANVQEELQRSENVFSDIVEQELVLNTKCRKLKDELTMVQQALEGLEFRLQKAQGTVHTVRGKREDELKNKNSAISRADAAKVNKVDWQQHLETAQANVAEAVEGAERVCPRVKVTAGKSSTDLEQLWKRLIATREEQENQLGGSQDELLRQANEAKRIHKDAMQELEDIKSLRNHLINTLNHRRNRWRQFRSGISVRARVTFNYLLSERKYRGTLSIDHKKGLLDIHVQPDIMERSGDGRQTKTLSGGEKSYSTVCLLLSLWDAMGSPIRCLDEFDVFMDSVNRERSMHMIIEAARRSIGRQFIFITPQSMQSVHQTSDVKIIKMSDPERGQTALHVQRG
ncbi:Structural maintenance of chromosomes protein 6 [Coniothyrium glycines]